MFTQLIDNFYQNKLKWIALPVLKRLLQTITLASVLFLCGSEVWGQTTRTWDGGGTNDRWTNQDNWSGNTVPADGNIVVIPAGFDNTTISRVPNITLNSFTVASNNIVFTANGTATTITVSDAAATVTISGSATLGGGTTGNAVNLSLTNFTSSTISGTLSVAANASLVLAANRTLTIPGALINNGIFTANNNNSTVNYNGTGLQNIVTTAYHNLTAATSGTKTLLGDITVNNNLSITGTATLATSFYQITGNTTGTLTMASGAGLTLGNTGDPTNVLFPLNYTAAHISLHSASMVTYQTGGPQTVSSVPTYGGFSISGGNTKTINGHMRVSGDLNLNNGILELGSYNLTLSSGASTSGSFSATSMIDIGSSSVIKEGDNEDDFELTIPIGIGTAYTPVVINSFSATVSPSSTITLTSSATAASGVPGTNPLNRHWVTSTSGLSGSVLADISFTYVAGDGTSGNYEIIYRPTSTGIWAMPNGASAKGINPLRASAATTLDATWTATEPVFRIFYSLKSGSWDDPTTWTFDPSGTQPLNPNNYTPTTSPTSAYDEVHVLSGRTVTVPADAKLNSKLAVTGTLDFGTTASHSFATIAGSGRIRLAGDNFPTGNATDFITAGEGEGTVEYYGITRNISTAHTFYNVDVNMDDGNTLTLLADFTMNGNLTITNGIFSINNSSASNILNITVNRNLNVEAAGSIITGSADVRHQLNLYGDFTNNGTVNFSNRTAADYTTEASNGIIDVNFLNDSKDQSILCKGVTNFYRIEIDKGTDYTYTLNIDATATSNFSLFGFANENHSTATSQLAANNNALGLVYGSVRIGNSIVIPALSNAAVYNISAGAQLWVDRGTVQKNTTGTIGIFGKLKVSNGTLEALTNSGITFCSTGILNVEGGTVNTNQIRTLDGATNYGAYIQTAGTVNVVGGSTNTDYYVFSLPYSESVFNMSGGTLIVNTSAANGGILINSGAENTNVTGGTVIAEANSTRDFVITSAAPFWNFSLKNATTAARAFTLEAASNIGTGNINVPVQSLKVLNDLRLWGTESGGSTYAVVTFNPGTNDVYIGGSFYIENGAQYVPISGGLAPYDIAANQPTAKNTTYFNQTSGTAMVEVLYQGNISNPLEFGNLEVERSSGYEVELTSGSSRANESVALDVNGTASVLSGTLDQNMYTLRTWGAIINNDRMGTWTAGVTPSHAQIQFKENPSFTLTTSDDAVFGNVQINVSPASSTITLTSDVYIERMEYVQGLIYLKSYNLKLDNLWNMATGLFINSTTNSHLNVGNSGYSGNSMIYTDGNASDGGLSIKITANSGTENQNNIINNFGPVTYPIGFISGGTRYFRPAQVVIKNYSKPGYLTIRPVSGALPTTNLSGGEVLQHYWRVSNSGFTELPKVAYRFYYRNQSGVTGIDLATGASNETSYVPGKVLDGNPFTRSNEVTSDLLRSMGTDGNTRFITFNGTSTSGLFSPASAGITLEDANYTAGVTNRFMGSVLIYYTRDFGTGNGVVSASTTAPTTTGYPNWTDNDTWTRSDILDTDYDPHDSRQPAVDNGDYPGDGDVAEIGWVPWTDTQKATAQGQPHGVIIFGTNATVAELIFKKMTDAAGNPVSRKYRSNFQFRPTLLINTTYSLNADIVKGEGLFWNRYSTPDFTAMDMGDFAREDSSYVLYETNGTGTTTTISNAPPLYPNLMVSSRGWGVNDNTVVFSQNIETTGNVEILGNSNILLNNGATGNFTIGRNLYMFEQTWAGNASGGGAELRYQNAGTTRTVKIAGDLVMANSDSKISVLTPGTTPITHQLRVNGDIIQGTAGDASIGLDLYSAANSDRITLYLEGDKNMTYNLVNGTIPDLYRLIINKGSSLATTAQWNCDFNLNGPTLGAGVAKALELQNGLFIVNNSAVTFNLTTGSDNFKIPATAGLEMLQGTAYANGTSGIALDGLLRLSGGNVNMAGGDNSIIYSSSGSATIEITNNNSILTVGGQVRRSATSNAGILNYSQTAGTMIAGNNSAVQANRGVFEILNEGSSFTMTGGDLYIARAQTSPTISAFYFDPETYNIGLAANIHIGHTLTPASQTIGIYAGKPLPKLRIDNSGTLLPKVNAKLEIVPANITSLLQIDAGTTFDANGLDLTLDGDMTALGTFIPNGNTTFLSGSVPQIIRGNSTTLNFYNLDKTATNAVSLYSGTTPVLVSNTLSLRGGIFTDNGNTITVKGDVLNDATHVYVDIAGTTDNGIVLNGEVAQELTGNGTFGKLTINNPNGIAIPVGNQLFITNSLKMQSGVFNIGKNLLDLGVSAIIEEASAFSSANMIETNISFTDNGLRKTFPSGATSNFIFPMGSAEKYTPVAFTISANSSNTGSITVKPANEIHPGIIEDTETGIAITDSLNALQYYWTLNASGISGLTATATMKCIDTDVLVSTPPYTTADYFTASLLANSTSGAWTKFSKADFDEVNNSLSFGFSAAGDDEISGDYTAGAGDAGLNGAIPGNVTKYTSNQDGNWVTSTIWTPNVTGGPASAWTIVSLPDIVDVYKNYIAGYKTEVLGRLNLYKTYGHRLGIVNGTGTIYLELGDLPAAVYDDFFSSTGGTLEFGGTDDYEFLGNITEINNLVFSGSGDKKFPNNNLTLHGDLTINGTAGLNVINYNNRTISLDGDLARITGSFEAGSGTNATLAFTGANIQTIAGSFTGSNALYNMEIKNSDNTYGVTINTGDNVEVDGLLELTDGLLTVSSGSLFRLNFGATVSPAAGSSASFINGRLTKELMNGNNFTFPIGNYFNTLQYGPITLKTITGPAGINDWSVSYAFAAPPYDVLSFAEPIKTVSAVEYWNIEAPAGGASIISIPIDGSSDVANSNAASLSYLRVVGWNPTTLEWEVVGTSATTTGTAASGIVTTTGTVDYDNYSYFTLGCINPTATSIAYISDPSDGTVSICNGASTTITVTFSGGDMPYILTYTNGSTSTTTAPINETSYSFTVIPASTTTYTLVSVKANGELGSITGISYATVTVNPIPTVTLSSDEADKTICENEEIVFTATSGLASYQFRVDGISAQTDAINTYTTDSLASGTRSIDVIGTSAAGCSATSSSLVITVDPLPSAAGTIDGEASVCLNTTETYAITAITNATGYIWSATNGATMTGTGTSRAITFPNSGTSVITVSGTNACGNGISASFSVAVSNLPKPDAAGNIASSSSAVCKGGTGYTYSVATINNATSYIWAYSGTGATIHGTGNEVTVDFALNATTGNLTVAGYNGCNTGDASSNFGISVNTPPTATISPVTTSTCGGTAITITATPSGGAMPYTSHVWTGTGASSLNFTNIINPLFNNITGGDYALTYTVTDNNSCTASASTTVTVYEAPQAYAGTDATGLCSGMTPITMTGATASGSYSGTPAWSGTGGIWTQNPNPALATFTPSTTSGSTTATLTLTGANGCSDATDTRLLSWGTTISQPGSITAGSTPICQGQDVVFSVPNDASASSYNWSYTGIGATISGTVHSVTISFGSSATSGTLSVTATNGCGTSSASTLDLTVNASPLASILSGNTTSCAGESGAEFSVTNSTAWNYNWNVEDGDGTVTGSGSSITVDWLNNASIFTGADANSTSVIRKVTVIVSPKTGTGCSRSLEWDVTINRLPETGPAYHVPNDHNE